MEYKRKLIESKPTDSEVLYLAQLVNTNLFLRDFAKKYWKRGAELKVEEESGQLKGYSPTPGDTAADAVQVTREVFGSVIRGFSRFMDDSFVRKYSTESDTFYVPKTEYNEQVAELVNSGLASTLEVPPHGEKAIEYVLFDLSSEKGSQVSWTRSLIESCTFDAQAEMLEGLGHNIAYQIMYEVLGEIINLSTGVPSYLNFMPKISPTFTKHASGGITWSQFLDALASVEVGYTRESIATQTGTSDDVLCVPADLGSVVMNSSTPYGILLSYSGTIHAQTWVVAVLNAEVGNIATGAKLTLVRQEAFAMADGSTTGQGCIKTAGSAVETPYGLINWGPADVVLCDPQTWFDLFNILQFTNSLYAGSADAIKSGQIKSSMGVTIIKQSLLPADTIVALNSAKAIALVMRRNLKIEPILFPIWNTYGFIGTVRFKAKVIFPEAMQVVKGA